MILDLVSEDDPILHEPVLPFDFSGDIDPVELADNLYDTMVELNGIGLSANQVGINTKVFVIGYQGIRIDVFNPEIVDTPAKDVLAQEGCLSFPGMYVAVKRPGAVYVRYQDSTGKVKEDFWSGITARVFLHEYDHMLGITMKDKISKLKWDLATKRKNKKNRR
jgi:peptide deformylase